MVNTIKKCHKQKTKLLHTKHRWSKETELNKNCLNDRTFFFWKHLLLLKILGYLGYTACNTHNTTYHPNYIAPFHNHSIIRSLLMNPVGQLNVPWLQCNTFCIMARKLASSRMPMMYVLAVIWKVSSAFFYHFNGRLFRNLGSVDFTWLVTLNVISWIKIS